MTGIWVAKFEAGYAGGNNSATVKASSVNYTQENAMVWYGEADTKYDSEQLARNWLDGVYGKKQIAIKYPTFQGVTYSMNYINHSDAFNISRHLTDDENIYELNQIKTDSHLMKNSEWGAVAYLSQSKYGLDGQEIKKNGVTLNSKPSSAYAVTGCTGDYINTTIDKINSGNQEGVYIWKQNNGTKSSSTGTIYGIYDLSGGHYERIASYINNGNDILNQGTSVVIGQDKSTKYATVYPYSDVGNTEDEKSEANYMLNDKIYGDSVRETSTKGSGNNGWYTDNSSYPRTDAPFFYRGGSYYEDAAAGISTFRRNDGQTHWHNGFRSVLV